MYDNKLAGSFQANSMQQFKVGHATAEQWEIAAKECLEQLGQVAGANLGFLYLTDLFLKDLIDIVAFFKETTGIQDWVGTTGIGICSSGIEYFDKPAMAVMVAQFPPQSFKVFSASDKELVSLLDEDWYDDQQPMFAVVHGDPRNIRIIEMIQRLSEQLNECFLVGGLTSSRDNYLQIANKITEGGLSGVLFSKEVQVVTQLSQGCTAIGPRHQITDCSHNIIIRLDNLPALDVFNQDIGEELASDLGKVGGYIFAALPVAGSDLGDYLVRTLIGIDPQHKLLAIGDNVQPGMSILFTRRDIESASEDLVRMLNHLRSRIHKPPKGGIYYSCLGRGKNLFGNDSQELKIIQNTLGDFPLVGFFANGEIYHQRLYGYTGILTLFL